jgi:hypothetical protein
VLPLLASGIVAPPLPRRTLVQDSGVFPLLGVDDINNMLGEYQHIFLFGWLKVAIEGLRSYTIRPGQALALVGPRARNTERQSSCIPSGDLQ